jgi:hypothetical protein
VDKSQYQLLRWSVECHIANSISDPIAARALADAVMHDFVKAISTAQVARAAGKRAFRTFRRDTPCDIPQWAFRIPGSNSREFQH